MLTIYNDLKREIEGSSVLLLLAEIVLFIISWSMGCFIYFMGVTFDSWFVLLVAVLLVVFFILSSFCAAELSCRVRKAINQNKKINNQKGWILVESLVGIVILSIALVAMMAMYTQATKANTASRDYDAAVYVAQRHLEDLKEFDGTSTIRSLSSTSMTDTVNGVTFTTQIARIPATSIAETLDNHIYPYQATVSWPGHTPIQVAAYYYSD